MSLQLLLIVLSAAFSLTLPASRLFKKQETGHNSNASELNILNPSIRSHRRPTYFNVVPKSVFVIKPKNKLMGRHKKENKIPVWNSSGNNPKGAKFIPFEIPSSAEPDPHDTPNTTAEYDTALQRPGVRKKSGRTKSVNRSRRWVHEDTHDWNYDAKKFDYDQTNEEAMVSVLAKNWQKLALRLFAGLILICFCFCCCYTCFKNMCRTICSIWGLFFANCTNCCWLCGCCKEDPGFKQMKYMMQAMGMELDYKTYMNMKEGYTEAIIEQGTADPMRAAQLFSK